MLPVQESQLSQINAALGALDTKLGQEIAWANDKEFSGKRLSAAPALPELGYTIVQLLIEARRVVRAIRALPASRAKLASSGAIATLLGNVNSLSAAVDGWATATAVLINAPDKPVSINDEIKIVGNITGDVLVDIPALAPAIASALEALKSSLPAYAVYSKVDQDVIHTEVDIITKLSEDLQAKTAGAAVEASEAAESKAKATAALGEILSAKDAINSEGDQLKARLSEIIALTETDKTTIESLKSEIESLKADAQSQCDALSALVGDGQKDRDKLQVFAADLKNISDRLAQTESAAAAAHGKQEAYNKKVLDLIDIANKMVSGATIAGLAKAFSDERADLDRKMIWAATGFYFGIFLIMVFTSFLAAYVFQIRTDITLPWKISAPLADKSGVTLSGFFTRAVILLGPVWMTLFSARRYQRLFDLRQQYSHKYNMAFSVEGFKQQAPTFQEQIAYWVFQIVGANPVPAKSDGRDMGQHPVEALREWLGKTIGGLSSAKMEVELKSEGAGKTD